MAKINANYEALYILDPALGEEIGKALGEETASYSVNVILGPGLNTKRSPLCGRDFEYFSEDPYPVSYTHLTLPTT